MIDIRVGDCREILKTLLAGSVQSCITSPAYWGLRDYGLPPLVWGGQAGCEHEWGDELTKHQRGQVGEHSTLGGGLQAGGVGRLQEARQGQFCQRCGAWRGCFGLEPTPELYVEHLVQVFRDVRRVLRDDGTCWLNLGDSYGHGTNAGREKSRTSNKVSMAQHQAQGARHGEQPKQLLMIPFRVALALQADGWWVRQTIIWSKPNGMPESVTDRPTTSHEYIFLLAKSERYFYDAEAIKDEVTGNAHSRGQGTHPKCAEPGSGIKANTSWSTATRELVSSRNKRSVWTINTEPYKGAHFATFPTTLVEPMIKASTSERGCCPACGAAWVREVERELTGEILADGSIKQTKASRRRNVNGAETSDKSVFNTGTWHTATTIGWRPSCNCPAHEPVPCTVLDPFFGAGTVGLVADRLGRDCIGIELNPKYVKLAEKRIKDESPMFVQIQVR